MVPPRRLSFWRPFRDPLLYLDFMLNSATSLDPFGHFWFPFGLLLVPFGSLLVLFGSLLVLPGVISHIFDHFNESLCKIHFIEKLNMCLNQLDV